MVYSEAQGLIEGLQGILFGSVLKCFQSRDRLVILQGEGEGGASAVFPQTGTFIKHAAVCSPGYLSFDQIKLKSAVCTLLYSGHVRVTIKLLTLNFLHICMV